MRKYLALIILILPWILRRYIYQAHFKYEIHSQAYIGFSWIYPDKLYLKKNARIGHLNICKNIAKVKMMEHSIIGSLNWITGFPLGTKSKHFNNEINRMPALILEKHSAITGRHLIDCTNTITIGAFTTVAGSRSQLLTHSIDIIQSKQTSSPISIGKYCFIGTNSVIVKGSVIPHYSVFGAMSLINKKYDETYCLYGGIPAKKIKLISKDSKYFLRKNGFID